MRNNLVMENLKKNVHFLSVETGSRGYSERVSLEKTIDYISEELKSYGYEVLFQNYNYNGQDYKNIYIEIKGKKEPEKILLTGAHYDTVVGTPGADDNGSGVSALLELARLVSGKSFEKTIQMVFFTLEEPPCFHTEYMGSYIYARELKESGKNIEGMICLEMIGYFSNEPESQNFPHFPVGNPFPHKGNFIAFVSDLSSEDFLWKIKKSFMVASDLPVESISVSKDIVPDIALSDHSSFWEFGYKGIMITDTSFYRNPNYHEKSDTYDTLDYESLYKVVMGLAGAVEAYARVVNNEY